MSRSDGNLIIFRYSSRRVPEVVDVIEGQNADVKGYIEDHYLPDSTDGERYMVYDRIANEVIFTYAVVVKRTLELVII